MSKLVVKKHRPFEMLLVFLLFSTVFSIVVCLLVDANYWTFIKNRLTQSEGISSLWQLNQELEAENELLREKVTMLGRSTQIDRQTAVRLQDEIRTLQGQIYGLKGELEFYQGIMSATKDSKGLSVQGLHIEATGQARFYRFRLVLTNVAKSDKVIEVAMDMSVEGIGKTGSQTLSLNEIVAGSQVERNIKFKNFERVEGNLVLPEGFKPLRVIVVLRQKGLKKPTVRRVFEWPGSAD